MDLASKTTGLGELCSLYLDLGNKITYGLYLGTLEKGT